MADTLDEPQGRADGERWVLVPYDGSPTARALLASAAILARQHAAGILLAVGGTDARALTVPLEEACRVLPIDTPIVGCLLAPGDPRGALERAVRSRTVVALAVPLGGPPLTAWYVRAVRFMLRGTLGPTVAFYMGVRPQPARALPIGAKPFSGWRLSFGRRGLPNLD